MSCSLAACSYSTVCGFLQAHGDHRAEEASSREPGDRLSDVRDQGQACRPIRLERLDEGSVEIQENGPFAQERTQALEYALLVAVRGDEREQVLVAWFTQLGGRGGAGGRRPS